jgi:histidine triad (HIT) family protein
MDALPPGVVYLSTVGSTLGDVDRARTMRGVNDSPECLFCRIVAGDVPATILRASDRVIAIRDVSPQAPTHVLVMPREHHPDVGSLAQADPETLAELVREAAAIADADDLDAFRLVFNTGSRAGQSVFHVHGHVLGGREMRWPPG